MARKLRILLADLVHDYRPNHFCTPLGVGFVGEYLSSVYGSEVDVRLFKSPTTLLEAMRAEDRPDIIGMANYSWNYEINKLIMRRAAAELPDTMIVQGGPHIRIDNDGIADHLRTNPAVSYYDVRGGPSDEQSCRNVPFEEPADAPSNRRRTTGVAFLSDDRLVYNITTPRRAISGHPSPIFPAGSTVPSPLYLPLLQPIRAVRSLHVLRLGISVLNKSS